jgi:hypothetical protein
VHHETLESPLKLMRIGQPGEEKAAVLVGAGSYVDVSDIVATYDETLLRLGRSR